MSTIETGGPALACARCAEPSVIKQGRQWLCAKHYRFGQMRALAKRRGKAVPSNEQLHSMRGADLICPDCGIGMNWRSKDGQSTVASLQHYRDGTMAIVCRSCNTRHAFMPNDDYRDAPADHKLCPACGEIKPQVEFTKDNSRSGNLRRLGINQAKFWSRVGVTQSGGSRYESGRNIPRPVQMLLRIAYGTKAQAAKQVEALRPCAAQEADE